jgi:hypothetical protein
VIVALLVALSGMQALAVRCGSCAKMPCCDEEPSSQARLLEFPPCCRIVKNFEAPASRTPTLQEHESQLGPLLAAAWPPAPPAPSYRSLARVVPRVDTGPPIFRLNCSLLL